MENKKEKIVVNRVRDINDRPEKEERKIEER